jgi:Stress responsive A/B Barrel Domain
MERNEISVLTGNKRIVNMQRKNFIKAMGIGSLGIFIKPQQSDKMAKNMFVHHVYFWLKNPQSKEDKAKLVAGLEKLSKVKNIDMFHIGQPAGTNREVIDTSYSVSWLLIFKDKAAQDAYQVDPIHLKFVEECSSLWQKVLVYDSIDV